MDHPRTVVSPTINSLNVNPPLLLNTESRSRPDNCDGTYQANCDPSRAYTNITDILKAQDRTALLSYMDKYWVDMNGDNESFWEHEWGKHGTCLNTIKPSCYSNYQPQEEVGDFFQKVVDLFKGLDTYKVTSLLFKGSKCGPDADEC